ncbi:MAG: hypothetical protein A2289_01700 [Deltaproteobacteria bacterium RIFOXYA12_FULL_58_15]|nr:MAG: hypothetical protein A2289_01700 [Deltaproteobacteria bacterium RIFOXYA12_FULL_58_15]OGR08626.1 MAG: hypothetical protein A2341_00055 [Deltaproteobacteria bacterium RIFOXYB12_FULL_58_9]
MIEIVVTETFGTWYGALVDDDADAVNRVVDLLAQLGVALGYPHSSAIRGVSFPLRELRAQSHGKPLRVFYAFDVERQAVLLVGGDKTGKNKGKFYKEMIAKAEKEWRSYRR